MTDRREPQRSASKLSGYDQAGQRMQDQASRDPMALARRQVKEHQDYLEANLGKLERWITGGVDPRALVRFALLDMSAPKSDKLRAATRESIYLGLLACAVAGLEPGSLKGHAFLVPFAGKAQYMAGWKGLVVQARRSREVVQLTPNIVCENDEFDLDVGSGLPPHHKIDLRRPRGEIIAAYAVAKLVGLRESVVSYEVELLDREAIEKRRRFATARGESDAWRLWPEGMIRKMPVRSIANRLPMGADFHKGMAIEQAHEDGRNTSEVLDVFTDGEATRTEDSAERAASMRAQADGPIDPDEAAEIKRQEAGNT